VSTIDDPGPAAALEELDWNDMQEPGCYLHIPSGTLMRVYADELDTVSDMPQGAMRMVRLSRDPRTSLLRLRDTADRHGYSVHF
jgi:hypothetical protein